MSRNKWQITEGDYDLNDRLEAEEREADERRLDPGTLGIILAMPTCGKTTALATGWWKELGYRQAFDTDELCADEPWFTEYWWKKGRSDGQRAAWESLVARMEKEIRRVASLKGEKLLFTNSITAAEMAYEEHGVFEFMFSRSAVSLVQARYDRGDVTPEEMPPAQALAHVQGWIERHNLWTSASGRRELRVCLPANEWIGSVPALTRVRALPTGFYPNYRTFE